MFIHSSIISVLLKNSMRFFHRLREITALLPHPLTKTALWYRPMWKLRQFANCLTGLVYFVNWFTSHAVCELSHLSGRLRIV